MVADTVQMSNYVILATVDTTSYDSLKDLYEVILSLKKDVFADNERIIVRYSNANALDLVGQLLTVVDIPDYFVIFEQISSTNGIDFTLSNSHCIYPWINLEVGNLGDIKPCCVYKESIANIHTSSLKDAYFSTGMTTLRQQFRNGEYSPNCSTCWKNESAGIVSLRQIARHKLKDKFYRLDYVNDDYRNLQMFDLKLSISCNLSCKICNRQSSSKIAEQDFAAGIISKIQLSDLKNKAKWAESDNFWNQLLDIMHNLKYLDLYGGEPLMSKSHFKFLQKLIDVGVASNIKLDYNSNGTVFSEKFFDLWHHFKEVKVSFSIDDIEDRFENQRCGAVWVTVCENLKKFNSHRSNKFISEIYTTINSQNVFWIPELLDWYYTQEFDHIAFNMLYDPIEYCIDSMSLDDKARTINKLSQASGHPIFQTLVDILKSPKI